MLSKLSIFVTVTLAAFAIAAAPPLPEGGVPPNPSDHSEGPHKHMGPPPMCCNETRPANDNDVTIALGQLNTTIAVGTDPVFAGCAPMGPKPSESKGPQENNCTGQFVHCNQTTPDGSLAIGCSTGNATNSREDTHPLN